MSTPFWICAAAGFLVLAGCQKEEPYKKPLIPVKAERVQTYESGSTVRYSGSVEANARVDLAFRVSGYVDFIQSLDGHYLQDGDSVAKGEELARVRASDYQAKVEEAKSAVEQARAGIEAARHSLGAAAAARDKAKLDFDRASVLFGKQSLIKPEYDAAKAAFEAAQANYESAQAQISLGEARLAGAQAQVTEGSLVLNDTSLRSPMDGVVLKRLVEPGSLAGPGTGAFSLIDVSTVKVGFGAPDHLVTLLRTGQKLSVSTEAIADGQFTGVITKISPNADPRSRVFEIELSVANPQRRLKPGMIASVEVEEGAGRRKLPGLPLSAVLKSAANPNGYAVFVVDTAKGKSFARSRNVQLGDAVQDRIVVLSGVAEGDMVVTWGATLVHDGEEVEVVQ